MQEEDTEDNALKDCGSPVFRHEKIHIDSEGPTNGQDKLPTFFTEATLAAMENPQTYVDERLTGGKDAGRDRRTWYCCHKSRYH